MAQLIGRQNVDFEKDGNQIVGVKLHLATKSENVEGMAVYTDFITASKACYAKAFDLKIGSMVTPIYDRNGKVIDFA